jgi:hypothetical protein
MNHSFNERLEDIKQFYMILEELEKRAGGKLKLEQCDGWMHWPERGVYFFFEEGEMRTTSGDGLRVVRVGTHALVEGSKTTLWKRLSQHKGRGNGGGNHRGSVFRHHVGTALIARDGWSGSEAKNWNISGSASRDIRQAEIPLERAVSQHICAMPFLWLAINDSPGPGSHRGLIERNAIALLSNYDSGETPIDPASDKWLGAWASSKEIQSSHLWNVNHVAERYDKSFLQVLKFYVGR